MDELSLEEEFDILYECGEHLGARIVSPNLLEQQFILGEYKFIIFLEKQWTLEDMEIYMK